MNEDDVVTIGKFRRPARPGVNLTYDPAYGLRLGSEPIPPEPAAAAAWLRAQKGWLRVFDRAAKGHPVVSDFLAAWRKK